MAWEENIYKLKITDPVIGGGVVFTPDGGVSAGYANAAAVQLENRTDALKEQVDGVINDNGVLEVRVDDLEDKQIADKQELEASIATKANTIHTHTASDILDISTFVEGQIDAQKAVASGLATLGTDGKVPQAQLPSYVDDVLEFESLANFPVTGESGKIYIAIDTGSAYRWTGSSYFKINNSVSTADEALKLTNSRTISATGDATWSIPFNGTANVSATLTLSNTGVASGTYKSVTVDAKGRVTAGTNPTTLGGYGITDATPSSHIGTGGTSHAAVTTTTNGFMSSSDKSKLDGIAPGAEVNSVTSVQGRTGAVILSKTDVSLGNVENYPVATQVQAIAASVDTAYMTPLKTKQLVESGSVAVSADKLRTPISVSLTGDAVGTVANWDASNNASITTTVNIDASKVVSGTLSNARLSSGIADYSSNPTYYSSSANFDLNKLQSGERVLISTTGNTNTPSGSSFWYVECVRSYTGEDTLVQRAWSYSGRPMMAVRNYQGGVWADWVIFDMSNLNASSLTSGTIPSARFPSSGVVSGTYTKVTVDDTGRVTTGSSLVAADIPSLDASKVTTGTMAVARLPAASTSAVGVAQLNSATNSTSTTQAATPSAVKAAYDLAAAKISSTEKGVANGVATLGGDGKVPATQLPSYVDDVIEVSSFNNLPATGESGKIYVTTDTNDIYRWSGSGYIEIAVSAGTADTALRLATARTLSLTGDGSGSVAFDGSGDAAIPLTLSNTGVSAGTYPKVTVDGKGRVTAGSSLAATDIPALDASKIASGVIADARLSGTYTGVSITGNAATATKLASARTISLSGDATGSISFDGSANATIPVSVADNSHNHTVANVNGLQAALDAKVDKATGQSLMLDAERSKLAGIQVGAQVNVATNLAQGTRTSTGIPLTSSTGTGTTLPVATTTLAGLQSAADKAKLDGISAGAQVNSVTSVAGRTGAVTLVKGDVGLGNVDNTSDATKSIGGNAATATKLATSRTINGVSFDGSANITVADATKLPLTGGTLSGNLNISNTNPVLAIGQTGSPVQGAQAMIEFKSTNGQDVALRFNSYDAVRAPFGLHIEKASSNSQTGFKAYLSVEGDIVSGGIFHGNGSGLTALNASNLASGTLQDARLPSSMTGKTFTGKLVTATPATGSASINLPHGATPTTLVNGDMWTTTNGVYARVNGNTRDLYHSGNLADVSQAEAEAGTATTRRAWTAQRVRQAVLAVPEKPLEIKSANFTSAIGAGYFCTANLTATLPNPLDVTIPNGSLVRFNKANSAIVTVNAVNATISTDAGEDTSVIIDITEEVLFTFYNNKWWV